MNNSNSNSKAATTTQETYGLRDERVIILSKINNVRSIHVVDDDKLTGGDNNLWIPIFDQELFIALETIFMSNINCNNIIRIEQIRDLDTCVDYLVTFNKKVK
jgi:hypothetical protein